MKEIKTQIFLGDCKDILKNFENDYIDLIFTSPPYADRRVHTYGGIKPESLEVKIFILMLFNQLGKRQNKRMRNFWMHIPLS